MVLWSNLLVWILKTSITKIRSRKQSLITSNNKLLLSILLLLEPTRDKILMKPRPHGSKVSFMKLSRRTGINMMMIRVVIWTQKNPLNFSKAWSQHQLLITQVSESFSRFKIRIMMVPSTSKNWETGCKNLEILKLQQTSKSLRLLSIITLRNMFWRSTPPPIRSS